MVFVVGLLVLLVGIIEFVFYGVILKFKKFLYVVMILGGLVGVYIGLVNIVFYIFVVLFIIGLL